MIHIKLKNYVRPFIVGHVSGSSEVSRPQFKEPAECLSCQRGLLDAGDGCTPWTIFSARSKTVLQAFY